MNEPSVLDYLKDRLAFWRPPRLHLPEDETAAQDLDGSEASTIETYQSPEALETQPQLQFHLGQLPWRMLAGILIALVAQLALEPPARSLVIGLPLYFIAVAFIARGYFRKEWQLAALPPDEHMDQPDLVRTAPLIAAVVFTLVSYWLFGTGRFTWLNLPIWLLSIYFYFKAFWIPGASLADRLRIYLQRFQNRDWRIRISPILILWIAAVGLILFFRFYQLDQVPGEMVSDHAEKLLDVLDVTKGATPVYFTRNTGREAFQFYWTALIAGILKTGVTFMSLKIGTVLAGLLTLPYMYLLGKELGSRWVGFFAVILSGLAYWPNVFSRLGLRFPLYPLFVAPTLYYLIRGLRTGNRNDFILSGLALGIGLHGYTSIRILPFLVVIGVVLYLLHPQSRGGRQQAVLGLILIALIALAAFLPLLRYAVDHPDMFAFRAFSRLGSVERPLPGPAWVIFFQNLWNAVTMFFWNDGRIWVHSVVFRPALDFVSAALFAAGIILLVLRYIQRRHWLDLFLILAVPILMLPSILSLAFPDENPSLNRTSGAVVPVFLIVALGMDALVRGLSGRLKGWQKQALPAALAGGLVLISAGQNYDLVFNQYAPVYRQNTWNTSEMGEVIQGFASSVGSRDTAWVVGYPYWVDTRLVGFTSGYPGHDYAIWPDQIPATRNLAGPKLFILNLQDEAGATALKNTYPAGIMWRRASKVDGKDFLMFLVLPDRLATGTQPEGFPEPPPG